MQMKLWGIKKWMLLKNIGKNVTRKSTIFDIKNILVIYDLWFHSDKKIKNRFLNDELIWERTINTTESKASKKNPLSFSHVYEGPAWCGFMHNSWNRCSFSLEQQKGKRPSQIDTVMKHGGNIQVCSCGGLCNQHVCKMPIKYSSVGIYPEVI